MYGLYVYHFGIIVMTKRIEDRYDLPSVLCFMACVAVSITVAMLSYKYFETRFLRLKDLVDMRRKTRASGDFSETVGKNCEQRVAQSTPPYDP